MDSTTISDIPYPELSDVPNIPSHLEQFCEAVDSLVIGRHATTGARDSAITSPVHGQHVYIQSDNRLYVYRSDYGAWFPYLHSVIKAKGVAETLGNSTTYQDDNHIHSMPMKASTTYALRGLVLVTSPSAADFKMNLVFSAGTPTGTWGCKTTILGGKINSKYTDVGTQLAQATQGSPAVEFITIEGFIVNSASPCTMKLQWAKLGNDAGTTTVFGGSYLETIEVM